MHKLSISPASPLFPKSEEKFKNVMKYVHVTGVELTTKAGCLELSSNNPGKLTGFIDKMK